MSQRVTHYLKISLLDSEAEAFDAEALKRFVEGDAQKFHERYASEWGIDPDESWPGPEVEGYFTLQFIAHDYMQQIVAQISDTHPGLFVELMYWDDESAGMVDLVGGEVYEEIHLDDLNQAKTLSEWHGRELEWV